MSAFDNRCLLPVSQKPIATPKNNRIVTRETLLNGHGMLATDGALDGFVHLLLAADTAEMSDGPNSNQQKLAVVLRNRGLPGLGWIGMVATTGSTRNRYRFGQKPCNFTQGSQSLSGYWQWSGLSRPKLKCNCANGMAGIFAERLHQCFYRWKTKGCRSFLSTDEWCVLLQACVPE
ncbi:hypothetical protein DL89DRAFT_303857 [Linderina pennispora]|uniref:Uncharacterized protein n=1 Tax=Linderina pennispora TaxID=61395 RepID=A0A1Y1W2C8_9FUNG|nr:uncharacterized protein DL89DRAFT_303857 [Linderina pennispora]ORX67617.1 hypothetical protein DL89DRAFT_303857 [Linderina pennispora]